MTATVNVTPARLALLRDVADGKVYRVEQLTATYVFNSRTCRRCTRSVKDAEAEGLVHLGAWGEDARFRTYEPTAAGRAVLDAHPAT